MIWWKALSIRARLALFFATAIGLILLAYATYIAAFVHQGLKNETLHRLDQEIEIIERSLRIGSSGEVLWYAPHDVHEPYQPLKNVSWLDVHAMDGRIIYRVPELDTPGMDAEIPQFEIARRSGYFLTTAPNGAHLRVLQRDIEVDGQRVIARAALSEDQAERDLRTLLGVMAIGLPLAIALSGLGGYLLAGHALRPISRMIFEARSIHAERLDARLPIANPNDELGNLALTFNDLFSRLERSFEQLKRFTSDASHELRTPLAVIRSIGEVGLREHHNEHRYREIIGSMLEEIDRLTLLIEGLLTLTRADSGQMSIAFNPINIAELVEQVFLQLQVLAEEKRQLLELNSNGPVWISGDGSILRRAVVNIVDNAIKYTPEEGTVLVKIGTCGNMAFITVQDEGHGIPSTHQEKIFDRFYRMDAARTRSEGGYGLGLAIARWAVEAHSGSIKVSSSSSSGSVFRIELPLLVSQTQNNIAQTTGKR